MTAHFGSVGPSMEILAHPIFKDVSNMKITNSLKIRGLAKGSNCSPQLDQLPSGSRDVFKANCLGLRILQAGNLVIWK